MEKIIRLSTNIDDMTAEELGYAMEQLINAGALDVYFVPIVMKKNRPATELCVLTTIEQEEKLVELIFLHTTTLGLRSEEIQRYSLQRATKIFSTPYGEIRVKVAEGYGVTKYKIEHEDLARIAREQKKSISEIKSSLEKFIEL